MRQDSSVILVRASGFGTLPTLFSAQAGEAVLDRIFEAEGLPIQLLSNPAAPMPIAAMQRIFDQCARYLDDRTFGMAVGGSMGYRPYGFYALHGLAARTLREGLRRMAETLWVHHTGEVLELAAEGRHLMWRYVPSRPDRVSQIHAEHIVLPMIHFVRAFLGASWQPPWVEVIDAEGTDLRTLEDWLGLPVRRTGRAAGIAIPMAALSAPIRPGAPRPSRVVTLRELVADVVLKDAPEPARSISAIVAMRLLDGKSDIEGAARHAEMSVQGLQRRLREKGYTYREVLDSARRARAVHLLQETSLPIVAIAHELGYEEHTSFTRAFVRWEGSTPSEYVKGVAAARPDRIVLPA